MISAACSLIDAYAASMQSITILPFMSELSATSACTLALREGQDWDKLTAACPSPDLPARRFRRQLLELPGFLEVLGPILHQAVQRLLGGALVRDHVVMDALLHVEQQSGVDWLGPEVLHHVHGHEEVVRKWRACFEAWIVDHGLQA